MESLIPGYRWERRLSTIVTAVGFWVTQNASCKVATASRLLWIWSESAYMCDERGMRVRNAFIHIVHLTTDGCIPVTDAGSALIAFNYIGTVY